MAYKHGMACGSVSASSALFGNIGAAFRLATGGGMARGARRCAFKRWRAA